MTLSRQDLDIHLWRPGASLPEKHRIRAQSFADAAEILASVAHVGLVDLLESASGRQGALRCRTGWLPVPQERLKALRKADAAERIRIAAAIRAADPAAVLS